MCTCLCGDLAVPNAASDCRISILAFGGYLLINSSQCTDLCSNLHCYRSGRLFSSATSAPPLTGLATGLAAGVNHGASLSSTTLCFF